MCDIPIPKLLITDLQKCTRSSGDLWELQLSLEKLSNITKLIPIKYVWIQGYIEQLAGKENEVIIISDMTDKAKITQCNAVPGGSSWARKGMYCSVIGTLSKVCALPEIVAMKITNLNGNQVFSSLWPKEIEELKLLVLEKALPQLL
ncbi:hypothetical protein L9F63_013625 [Diploptera punctata]|uniref:RecQ-mediated genome instability protein 2 n=1 Tax=Diploptera punctata TaxID=6984 RepID=A0AAD8A9U5_DIPPU|nr:hypothetical protein L9F63_013625 [Diploptera punctata]